MPRTHSVPFSLLAVGLLVLSLLAAPAATSVAAESSPIAWAVNGLGGSESSGSTFEVLVDGEGQAEPLTVGAGGRVAIPGLVDGETVDVSFRNQSTGELRGPVTIRPSASDTVDVAVHGTPTGGRTATAFPNTATDAADGQRLLLRHTAAAGDVEFQLYRGGEGGALDPVGAPVTVSNAEEVVHGSTGSNGVTYTVEARLPDGTLQQTSFTPSAAESGAARNVAFYLTGLNTLPSTGGEGGPFILPVLATSGGGEGGNAGLHVINGLAPGATEGQNSVTIEVNGTTPPEGGTVAPRARVAVTNVTRGSTYDIGLRDSAGNLVGTETVTVPDSSSVDVVVFRDESGQTTTGQFDNSALASPVDGVGVVMRNIAPDDSVQMEIRTPSGGTVGAPVTVADGNQVEYGTDLTTGNTYDEQVQIDGVTYGGGGEGFTAGGESGRPGVRAVYAFEPGSGGDVESPPVRSFRVKEGPAADPLAAVNGFSTGATEGENAFDVRVDGVAVGEALSPRSRAVLPGVGTRGQEVTVEFIRAGTSDVAASLRTTVPTEGSLDVVVRPDGAGGATAAAIANDPAPSSGTNLYVRHVAAAGQVDVNLYEGGGETGGLTKVAGPETLDRGSARVLDVGLSSTTHTIEAVLADGTRLRQSFTPGGESSGAVQAAYLAGFGDGQQAPASGTARQVPTGTGDYAVGDGSSGGASGGGDGSGSTGGGGESTPPSELSEPFVDVPADFLFRDEIAWLYDQGITRGCNPPENDRFCPDDSVTRGQMAAFLTRALDLPGDATDWFVDDEGSVFEADIQALANAAITRGCNPPANDEYCPTDAVTRGQMAAFLTRALDLPSSSTDRFVDDDGSVFEADIQALAAAGITRGCNPPDNDRFCPDEPVTRAQMAAFLFRALG